jgi:myosin heavy subunit
MQSGNVAAAVVEAETHYSYQQQTSQQIQSQQNQTQNQILEQSQTQPTQIQSQNQISQQQVQTLRQMSQQPSNQASQVNQQVNQQQTHINQEQQNQTQLTQQLQQLQRQQREQFEKQRQLHHLEKQQHIHVTSVQEQQQTEIHRNNIILKTEDTNEQQNLQNDPQKNEPVVTNQQNQQTFSTVQATPEVFLSLGFKDALTTQVTREDPKDLKDFVKSSEDAMSRTSISHISEFLRIRSGPEQTPPLVTVNPQAISQTTQRQLACRECGKTFNSINQMNGHDCTATLLNEVFKSPESRFISFTAISCCK